MNLRVPHTCKRCVVLFHTANNRSCNMPSFGCDRASKPENSLYTINYPGDYKMKDSIKISQSPKEL